MRRFSWSSFPFTLVWGIVFLAVPAFVQATPPVLQWPAGLPVYDHVVIVVLENKDVEQIIGRSEAAYINGTLKKNGANFTRCFAEEHHSQGNYFWLFSGSNQDVKFDDTIPSAANNANYPFQASNLGQQLIAKGKSFRGYCEGLPSVGFECETFAAQHYARKHAPWISFGNIPQGTDPATSTNLRFADFPTDFKKLPTVAIVVPNLINDMHDGTPPASVKAGDDWLKKNIDPYLKWSVNNNSLLIVTFDECDDHPDMEGLTDPFIGNTSDRKNKVIENRIVTLFAGARIKPGDYPEGKGITHVNILRMLEAMYGCPKSGKQQEKALAGGISDDFLITDVFEPLGGK